MLPRTGALPVITVLTSNDRQSIRAAMRRQRQAVPLALRSDAAHAVLRQLRSARMFAPGLRVAFYLPIDGELDPMPAARYAAKIGCRLYLPKVLDMRTRRMEFVEYRFNRSRGPGNDSVARVNSRCRINPRLLDIALVPLVAFDMHGHRLGFGAGFYDRKFAFLRRGYRKRPKLIGIGYEFQQITRIIPSHWDVQLDAVATERGLIRCRRKLT
jgi:5-formyltetrahydrofolate cyclo-ligase